MVKKITKVDGCEKLKKIYPEFDPLKNFNRGPVDVQK